nr:glutaredoxin 3 [Xanthomonas euvesicatoria]
MEIPVARYHVSDLTPTTEFPVSQDHTDQNAASGPQITLYSSAICPYCVAAKNFLKSKGKTWTEVRIDLDPAERDRMIALAKRTSVPQIFVGDVHVGGYDDMMAMHRAGKLEPLLAGSAGGQA